MGVFVRIYLVFFYCFVLSSPILEVLTSGKKMHDYYICVLFIFICTFAFIFALKCKNCDEKLVQTKYLIKTFHIPHLPLSVGEKCPNCGHDPFAKPEHKREIESKGTTNVNKKFLATVWIICSVLGVPITLFIAWLQYSTWPPIVLDDGQDVTKFGLAFLGFMVIAFIGLGIRGLIWLRK